MMSDVEATKQSERTGHDEDSVAEAAYRRGYQQGAAYAVEAMNKGQFAEVYKYAHSTLSEWRYQTPLIPRRDPPDLRPYGGQQQVGEPKRR